MTNNTIRGGGSRPDIITTGDGLQLSPQQARAIAAAYHRRAVYLVTRTVVRCVFATACIFAVLVACDAYAQWARR